MSDPALIRNVAVKSTAEVMRRHLESLLVGIRLKQIRLFCKVCVFIKAPADLFCAPIFVHKPKSSC